MVSDAIYFARASSSATRPNGAVARLSDELDDTGIGTAGMSVAPMPELRGTGARKGPCRRGSRSRMRSARTYHWLYGDFGAWLTALRRRRVGAAALAAWALNMAWMSLRSHHLTFDWRDPLPTLGMCWKKFARPALRQLRGARPKPAAA